MATAPVARPTFNRAESTQKVRHPLQALRGLIRTYILAEGAAVGLIFIAVAFWLGFFLDWGMFNLYHVWNAAGVDLLRGLWADWVRELDGSVGEPVTFNLRLVLLIGVVLGLIGVVAYSILTRLFREFSDATLALVLERRFPRELGDRLITAVELADPELSKKYGYSQIMVDKTIKEAADRVSQLPVGEVFNWRRLFLEWGGAVALTVGLYLVALAGCIGGAAMADDGDAGRNITALHGNAFTWMKRNLFLHEHEYWLPEAYVEIARFQGSPENPNEMRVGRDEERPDIQARAYQWVIVDRTTRDGLRPLRFSDLQGLVSAEAIPMAIPATWASWLVDLDDLPASTPAGVFPNDWQNRRTGEVRTLAQVPEMARRLRQARVEETLTELLTWQTWTVDKLLQQLERTEVRGPLRTEFPEEYRKFETLLVELEQLAQVGPTGVVHKLDVPERVTVRYRGQTTKNDSSAERTEFNKYYIGLGDLKESVMLVVQANNFVTPARGITLVPPPSLNQLLLDRWEPAYLYHRVQGSQDQLRGKRQFFEKQGVSLTGELSTISIPSGSDVALVAVADRNLKDNIRILPAQRPKVKGALVPSVRIEIVPREEKGEPQTDTFRIFLPKVTRAIEFEFHFNDRDNVKGNRHIIIEPIDDRPPQEDGNIEVAAVLRKPAFKGDTSKSSPGGGSLDGFLITPEALLPFRNKFRDDRGLTKINWVFEVEQVEFELMNTGIGEEGSKKKVKTSQLVLGGNATMRRLSVALAGLQFTPGHPGYPWMTGSHALMQAKVIDYDITETAKRGDLTEGSVPLERFADKLAILREFQKDTPLSALDALLKGKTPEAAPFPRDHDLAFEDGFDVRKYLPKLKARDAARDVQHHYRLKLSVAATDNNVETGPSTTYNKLPITFLVVSEAELLTQILVEEENVRDRLEKLVAKLRQQKINLDEQASKLNVPDPALSLIGLRVKEAREVTQDGFSVAREALADYTRIHKEMKINRVDEKKTNDVDSKIVRPLEEIVDPTRGNFQETDLKLTQLWNELEADLAELKRFEDSKTKPDNPTLEKLAANRLRHVENCQQGQVQLQRLIDRLDQVLEAIGGEINIGQVIAALVGIEQQHRQNYERLRIYHEEKMKILLRELTGGQ